jgi:replicative DNA helicase
MLVTDCIAAVMSDAGLRPEHFYYERHRQIYTAATVLAAKDEPVDELTIQAELERRYNSKSPDRHVTAELAATVAVASNALHHARLVVEAAEWREYQTALHSLNTAIEHRDKRALLTAQEHLMFEQSGSRDWTPEQLQDLAFRILHGEVAEAMPWPLADLNVRTAGGMRRGEFIVVAGWRSHGKSCFTDQCLEYLARKGRKVRLYMNEMAVEERVVRRLARATGVPYSQIIRAKLNEVQSKKALAEINRWANQARVQITDCSGWTAREIANHLRRDRPDAAAIDVLSNIDYSDVRELDRALATLATAALRSRCALILVAHLATYREKGGYAPMPTLADLRGSGQVGNVPGTVCFVWQDQDKDTFDPTGDARIYLAKARNGERGGGGVPYRFDVQRLRFTSLEQQMANLGPR